MDNFYENELKDIKKIGFTFFKSLVKKVRQNDYSYIVIGSRSCLSFLSAIEKDIKNTIWYNINIKTINKMKNIMISSEKIDLIGFSFGGENVLLIDDSMFHGITLANKFDEIKKYFPRAIDTLTLNYLVEAPDYYYFRTRTYGRYYIYGLDGTYSNIHSTSIMSYIHQSSQIYSSNIYGFYVPENDFNSFIENNNHFTEQKIDYDKLCSFKLYENFNEPRYYFYNFEKPLKSIRYAVFKVYYPKDYQKGKNNKLLVVPYVELKNLRISVINMIWDKILKFKGINNEYFKELMNSNSRDKYRIITAIVSYELFRNFFDNSYLETKEIDLSYINNFIELVDSIIITNFNSINTTILDTIEECFCSEKSDIAVAFKFYNSEIMPKLLPNNNEKGEIYEIIKRYFFKVYASKENEFKKLIEAGIVDKKLTKDFVAASSFNKSLPISCLYSNLEKFNCNMNEIYAILLFLLDTDVCTTSIEANTDIGYRTINVGKESYHLFADLCKFSTPIIRMILNNPGSPFHSENTFNFNLFIDKLEKEYPKLEENKIKNMGDLDSLICVINNRTIISRSILSDIYFACISYLAIPQNGQYLDEVLDIYINILDDPKFKLQPFDIYRYTIT